MDRKRVGGLAWPEGQHYCARAPGFGRARVLLAKGTWKQQNPRVNEDKHQPRVCDSLLLSSSHPLPMKVASISVSLETSFSVNSSKDLSAMTERLQPHFYDFKKNYRH